jgi:hypothetical protein
MVIYCTIEKAIREDKIDYVVMGTDGAFRLVYFHRYWNRLDDVEVPTLHS